MWHVATFNTSTARLMLQLDRVYRIKNRYTYKEFLVRYTGTRARSVHSQETISLVRAPGATYLPWSERNRTSHQSVSQCMSSLSQLSFCLSSRGTILFSAGFFSLNATCSCG